MDAQSDRQRSGDPARAASGDAAMMDLVLPEALVVGFHRHIDRAELPDPDGRHVVAAAIEAKASHILTSNLRDFPANAIKRHGSVRVTPDAFLANLYDQAPQLVVGSIANARRNLSKSGISVRDFLASLKAQRLEALAKRLNMHTTEL